MTGDNRRREHGSALEKSLAIVEAITQQTQAIGLPDLTARLNLPRQTIHRILLQLEALGLVIRDPGRDRFAVGPRLSRLALDTLLSANRNAPVRAVLQDLVDDIHETCNVGVLDGFDFLYLERIESDWPLRVHLHAGSKVPAYCTSGGKALLAFLPEDQRRRLLGARALKRHTDKTITAPPDLERDLAACRAAGYSTNDEEYNVGIVGVGVPIFGAGGRVIAGLACHAPVARVGLDGLLAYVPRLQAAAERLSAVWDLE
ncbi:MAG: IclR family transcriptional regulator [Hyphomicrobiales bacterium]|nr:IclR family transcriptional regulator [Hyphomicrobiales bacterium]MCP5373741.1 IclR family transcriptional regulator [Hyphomicrobiales bacterium]